MASGRGDLNLERAVDLSVSIGCGDAYPVCPETQYMDWELDDPAGMSVGDVALAATRSGEVLETTRLTGRARGR